MEQRPHTIEHDTLEDSPHIPDFESSSQDSPYESFFEKVNQGASPSFEDITNEEELASTLSSNDELYNRAREFVQKKYPGINDITGVVQVLLLDSSICSEVQSQTTSDPQLEQMSAHDDEMQKHNREQFENATIIVKLLMLLLGYNERPTIAQMANALQSARTALPEANDKEVLNAALIEITQESTTEETSPSEVSSSTDVTVH